MTWIDAAAITPYYLELIMRAAGSSAKAPGLQVFRILRLVRVFRLFRMSKTTTTILTQTMQRSAKPMAMLVFFTTIAMVFFAALLYFCERGVYDEELVSSRG